MYAAMPRHIQPRVALPQDVRSSSRDRTTSTWPPSELTARRVIMSYGWGSRARRCWSALATRHGNQRTFGATRGSLWQSWTETILTEWPLCRVGSLRNARTKGVEHPVASDDHRAHEIRHSPPPAGAPYHGADPFRSRRPRDMRSSATKVDGHSNMGKCPPRSTTFQ
jgi:hypothetical protein